MAAALQQRSAFFAGARATTRKAPRLTAVSNGTKITMSRDLWLPGSKAPAHLDGTLPADYGFDPLGLGQNKELLRWYVESELVHCRWAMLAVAGILAQEIYRPDVFWYEAALKTESPFSPMGLLAFEFFAMHFVEVKRWLDWRNPGSQDVDPLFPQNKLKPHAVGYPGFTIFVPGDMEKLKVNEIRNGRLAMLAFIGFTMAGQVTGLNPLAALSEHLADPFGTTIFSKAAIVPGAAIAPPCAIAPTQEYYGITLPTPCFLQGLWP